jgi:hypothetical protein
MSPATTTARGRAPVSSDSGVAPRSPRFVPTAPVTTTAFPREATGARAPATAADTHRLALPATPTSILAPWSTQFPHGATGATDAGLAPVPAARHRQPSVPSAPRGPGGVVGLGSTAGAGGGGGGWAGGPSAVLISLLALAMGAGACLVLAATVNRSTALLSLIERPG